MHHPWRKPGPVGKPFDPVHQLGHRLAEDIRPQGREVEDAYSELDRRAESQQGARQQQAEQKAMTERMPTFADGWRALGEATHTSGSSGIS